MYEVWEISAYPQGQVILSSAGNGARKAGGFSWHSAAHDEGIMEEFRTPAAPAAANLNAALNWLYEQGHHVLSFVPAGSGFPPGKFWAITTRRDRSEAERNEALSAAPGLYTPGEGRPYVPEDDPQYEDGRPPFPR